MKLVRMPANITTDRRRRALAYVSHILVRQGGGCMWIYDVLNAPHIWLPISTTHTAAPS